MSNKDIAKTSVRVDIKQMVGKYQSVIDDVMNSKTKTVLDAVIKEFNEEKLQKFLADIQPHEFVRIMLALQSKRQEEYLIVADLMKKMAQALELAVKINEKDPLDPEEDEETGAVAVPPDLYALITRMSKKRVSAQQKRMIAKILDND
jgi:hypothetical protein